MVGRPRRIAAFMASILVLALSVPALAVDTDRDGLQDGFERKYGFSPTNPDTDGDGVVDSAEDTDRDGLGNLGEQRFGTHPRKRDSDGDGTIDSQEDRNRNGLSNGREQDRRRVPDGLEPSIGAAVNSFPPLRFKCQTPNGQAYPVVCGFGPLGATKIVLFGDSHAMMWSQPVRRVAAQRDWRFLTMTKTACPALLGIYNRRQMEIDGGTSCQQWRRNVIKRMKAYPPDLIIITQSDDYKLYSRTGALQPRSRSKTLWKQALKRTLDALPKQSQVLVLGDVPDNRVNPRSCLGYNRSDMSQCVTRRAGVRGRQVEFGLRDTARANGATFRTLHGKICSYEPCPVVQGRILMWRDRTHLTNRFAVKLQPSMRAAIDDALE